MSENKHFKPLPLLFPPIDLFPKEKLVNPLDVISEETEMEWALKLFSLGELALDYADTICDCLISVRKPETRSLVRVVRDVEKEYSYWRAHVAASKYRPREKRAALQFEEMMDEHLEKLHYGLQNEIKALDLNANDAAIVESAMQCLTILDAMKLYAEDCDAQIRKFMPSRGMQGHGILPDHFLVLAQIVKEFAGDCYYDSPTRRLTARILFNEIQRVKFEDDTECEE